REVVPRPEDADASHFVGEQLPHVFRRTVDLRRTDDHRVAATAGLAVVRQREGEAVRRRDGSSFHFESRDTLADGPRDVEHVVRAGDDVEVVTGNLAVHRGRARRVDGEVARAVLQI